ncbi:MAG TPA: hypothetical protein VFB37_12495 [Steroidobacteraceae bacterium]|nr:hypothetical protein [Steroidobacteraceae bacterium]
MDGHDEVSYDRSVNTQLRDVPRCWRCRVCGFDRYHRVSVMRKNGARYETSFYACSACSVMFLNDSQFDAASTVSPGIEIPPVVTPLRRKK